MKRLYEILKNCIKEEEIKSEFIKFFKFKLNAFKLIDHYNKNCLFEFKLDKNFKNIKELSTVIAQTMYYAKFLKYGEYAPLTLSSNICGINKNGAFIFETNKFKNFYTNNKYDWYLRPSKPDKKLIEDIENFEETKKIHIYDFSILAEENNFIEKLKKSLSSQMTFSFFDKTNINENNFLDVFEYWNSKFGEYVKNGRKPSEYFLTDIEENKTQKIRENEIVFDMGNGESKIKQLNIKDYNDFWNTYEKIKAKDIFLLRQRFDQLTEETKRKFEGEFYTPINFAKLGYEYLQKVLGKDFLKTGKYRLWDMACGSGNLEFVIPSNYMKYCYLSSLNEDDIKYLKKIYPDATCFQYDFLNDDIDFLDKNLFSDSSIKLPKNLLEDIQNIDLKWVVFINPPWGTANNSDLTSGKKTKNDISKTKIRDLMIKENLGDSSQELCSQFLYRIDKQFKDKKCYLGLYSKIKYLNSDKDQLLRDNFLNWTYKNGFIFSIKNFSKKSKIDYPVGFLIWDLFNKKNLKEQIIKADIFDSEKDSIFKIGEKTISSNRNDYLNKWFDRPKNEDVFVPFFSALNYGEQNKKIRLDKIAKEHICSLMSNSNDFQNQNITALFSGACASGNSISIISTIFEKSMIIHCVRRIENHTWLNDRDQFYQPNKELSEEFINDCIVWSLFSDSNNTVSLKDVVYKGKTYQVHNNLFPFLLDKIKNWKISSNDFKTQISIPNLEDRFMAKYLNNISRDLSEESKEVVEKGKELYKFFYENISKTNWKLYKCDCWDVGLYQIKMTLKESGLGIDKLNDLKTAHKKLREKLLPQVYYYGFLIKDCQMF